MDVTTVVSMIGSLGFPIVMCLLMYQQNKDVTKQMGEMSIRHSEDLNALKNAIDNNTTAITNMKKEV